MVNKGKPAWEGSVVKPETIIKRIKQEDDRHARRQSQFSPNISMPRDKEEWPEFLKVNITSQLEFMRSNCLELWAKTRAGEAIETIKSESLPKIKIATMKALAESRDWNNREGIRTRYTLVWLLAHLTSYVNGENLA
jgi:hypothetical protein